MRTPATDRRLGVYHGLTRLGSRTLFRVSVVTAGGWKPHDDAGLLTVVNLDSAGVE